MKQIILLITAGLVVTGCCSTRNDYQNLSTSDLELRRYELNHCLSMARLNWDKQTVPSNAYNEVQENLAEKEAVEQEITRRGVTDYRWRSSVTYPYAHHHCNCESWVAYLPE